MAKAVRTGAGASWQTAVTNGSLPVVLITALHSDGSKVADPLPPGK